MIEVSKFKIDLKGRGRTLLALLIAVIFITARSLFPMLPITDEQFFMVIGLIVAYILGEGISGKTFDDNFLTLMKSQKFLAFVAGMAVMIVKIFVPTLLVTNEQVLAILGSLSAFIVASGTQKPQPPAETTQPPTEPPVLG